jgi:hypothetical protein
LRRPTDPPALLVGAYDDARIPMRARPELARVYEQLRDADSAIAVYERYLTSHPIARTRTDAFELGNVLEHLARLHVERGNGTRAAELYLRLADQWRAADPPLLARAAAARQSAASLRPTAGPY